MSEVLAYFLTWTTYGTWLHGDDRGSVDETYNRPATPLIAPNPARHARARHAMRYPPFVMNEVEREIVRIAIEDHTRQRNWLLHAINVRTNHVHVVVRCRGVYTPDLAMQQFKSWGSRRLIEAKSVERGRRIWTDHGSTRWIKNAPGLFAAIDYVKNQQ